MLYVGLSTIYIYNIITVFITFMIQRITLSQQYIF